MSDIEKPLRRAEAAEFLTSKGFPIAVSTLAKLATIGGGPIFRRYGRWPVYQAADLLDWARNRTSQAVHSTSELPRCGGHPRATDSAKPRAA